MKPKPQFRIGDVFLDMTNGDVVTIIGKPTYNERHFSYPCNVNHGEYDTDLYDYELLTLLKISN